LQKSIKGLFRTILYQIFQVCPKLAELVLSKRIHQFRDRLFTEQNDWTLEQLEEVLGSLKPSLLQRVRHLPADFVFPRICILIDGLDEYDGHHSRLVQTLQGLASDGSMKLCLSSRPWHVFVRAFESHKPHLTLQDLTHDDITLYVDSNLKNALSTARRFEPVSSTDEDAASIVSDIVNRAEGVFLWVYLVVQSVLRGFDTGDTTSILRQRVNEFPTDLESFFQIMLARVDAVYRHQTWQALYLAYLHVENADAAKHSSYLDFELLNRHPRGLEDPQYLYDLNPQPLTPEDFQTLARKTRTFLSACCKDLLLMSIPTTSTEAYDCAEDPSRWKVQFLHRTVFEYLDMNLRGKLEQSVPECMKTGAVFHLLNMGKLKYHWSHKIPWTSRYFAQQASFSLDQTWPGVTIAFVEQLQQCQPLHQTCLNASLGAAYIAFEQFERFLALFSSLANHVGQEHHHLLPIQPSDSGSADIALLPAALGIAACRHFPVQNIHVGVLGEVITYCDSGVTLERRAVITRFLESTLPSLVDASNSASTGITAWNDIIQGAEMQHVRSVFQLLLSKSPMWKDCIWEIFTKLKETTFRMSNDCYNKRAWDFIARENLLAIS
jgi:hypothetical protein